MNYWLRALRARFSAPRLIERLGNEETLRRVIDDGVALSRFGDGELKLALYGKGLRFQRHSPALEAALAEALLVPKAGVLACFNTMFAENAEQEWVARYERYPKNPDGYRSIHAHNDILVLRRSRQQREYRRHWRIIAGESGVDTYGSAGVFFLGLHVEEYARGEMEAVLDRYRALFNGRRILFVCPDRPMGGLSFAEQLGTMQRIGLRDAQFIKVPETDAFEHSAEVRQAILASTGFDDLFIQAGPAATVWAHQFAGRIDGRVLDVGSLSTQLRHLG